MQHGTADVDFETALLAERGWLVRLCARLTNRTEAAEDLAQETLLEAWRNRHKFRGGPEKRAWLAAIARFVCLRWQRRKWRDRVQGSLVGNESETLSYDLRPSQSFDIETALNRSELADLLDRAMILLPPETRTLLVQQYMEETPRAEMAARLGVAEGAVAVRLHRGRLALRRILTTDLKAEAAALGLVDGEVEELQETRLWCPNCGARRLVGRFNTGRDGEFLLRCPQCHPRADMPFVQAPCGSSHITILCGVKGYKPALSRLTAFFDAYYREGILHGSVHCLGCGKPTTMRLMRPVETTSKFQGAEGAYARCSHCRTVSYANLRGLVLCAPQVQQFWRAHPRLRTLPDRHLQLHGRAAVVTRLASMTTKAELEIVSAADTYETLDIYETQGTA